MATVPGMAPPRTVLVSPSASSFINQGQVINHGKAISKSLGNGVDLGEQIERFGAGSQHAPEPRRCPRGL